MRPYPLKNLSTSFSLAAGFSLPMKTRQPLMAVGAELAAGDTEPSPSAPPAPPPPPGPVTQHTPARPAALPAAVRSRPAARPRPHSGPIGRRQLDSAPARANGSPPFRLQPRPQRAAAATAPPPSASACAPPPSSRGRKANAIAPPQNGGPCRAQQRRRQRPPRGEHWRKTSATQKPAAGGRLAGCTAGSSLRHRPCSADPARPPAALHSAGRPPRPGPVTNLGCRSRCGPSRAGARGSRRSAGGQLPPPSATAGSGLPRRPAAALRNGGGPARHRRPA